MKKLNIYLVLPILLMLCGCSTVMNSTTQEIEIISTPPNAKLTIDGRRFGTTPQIVNIERGSNHTVKLELPGHDSYEILLTTKLSDWVWLNALNGFIPGFTIDFLNGAMYNLHPSSLNIPLTILPEPKPPVKK